MNSRRCVPGARNRRYGSPQANGAPCWEATFKIVASIKRDALKDVTSKTSNPTTAITRGL